MEGVYASAAAATREIQASGHGHLGPIQCPASRDGLREAKPKSARRLSTGRFEWRLQRVCGGSRSAEDRVLPSETPVAYSRNMTDAEWKDIDADIVARRILAAVAKVRVLTESGTRDAFQQVRARYDRLRAAGTPGLDDAPEDYWAGFLTLLRRRTFPTTQAAPEAPVADKVPSPDTRRAKGERRIEVDGVAYFWRVPCRATGDQEDLTCGLFAVVRLADGTGPRFNLHFPQLHPSVSASPVPLRPSDIANALRARPAPKDGLRRKRSNNPQST